MTPRLYFKTMVQPTVYLSGFEKKDPFYTIYTIVTG